MSRLVELEIFTHEFLNGLPTEGRIPQEETPPLAATLMNGLQKALLRTPGFLEELGITFFADPTSLSGVFGLGFDGGGKPFQLVGYIHPPLTNYSLTEYFGTEGGVIRRQILLSAEEITFLEFLRDGRIVSTPRNAMSDAHNGWYEDVQGVLRVIEDLDPQPSPL